MTFKIGKVFEAPNQIRIPPWSNIFINFVGCKINESFTNIMLHPIISYIHDSEGTQTPAWGMGVDKWLKLSQKLTRHAQFTHYCFLFNLKGFQIPNQSKFYIPVSTWPLLKACMANTQSACEFCRYPLNSSIEAKSLQLTRSQVTSSSDSSNPLG